MTDSRKWGTNKPGNPGLKKNLRVGRVTERILSYLWAPISILLILTAIYLALKGHGR